MMARDSAVQEPETTAPFQLANEWIFDYAYHVAMDEFQRHGTVHQNISRDFIQGVLKNSMDLTGKPKLKQQLILIICKLADGSDCNARYEDEPKDATALEEALELFPDLIEWCNDLEMWDTCMTKLRKQAVFVCCAGDNVLLAQEVFDRIYADQNETVRKEVQAALNSEVEMRKVLSDHPYSSFLEAAARLFSIIHKNHMTEPSLLRAVDQELRRSSKKPVNQSIQTDILPEALGVTLDRADFRGLLRGSKLADLEGKPVQLPQKWCQRWHTKVKQIQQNREHYISSASIPGKSDLGEPGQNLQNGLNGEEYPSTHKKRLLYEVDKNLEKIRAAMTTMQKNHGKDSDTETEDIPNDQRKRLNGEEYPSTRRKRILYEVDKNLEKMRAAMATMRKNHSKDSDTEREDFEDIPNDQRKRLNGEESPSTRRKRILYEVDKNLEKMRAAMATMRKNHGKDSDTETEDIPNDQRKRLHSKNVTESDSDSEPSPLKKRRSEEAESRKAGSLVPSPRMSSKQCDFRAFRLRRSKNRHDRHAAAERTPNKSNKTIDYQGGGDSEDASSSVERCVVPKLPKGLRLRDSLAPRKRNASSRVRIPWEKSEEEKFYQAVQQCGFGRWAVIRERFDFGNRTNVHLKDKWRQMGSTGRLKKLAKKFGDS